MVLNFTHSIFFRKDQSKTKNDLALSQKIFFRILLFLFPAFVLNNNVYATHSMGADMSYTCLGNNTYNIRVSFYRDCIGIPASPYIYISAYSASCNLTDSAILFPIPGTGQDITPLCPSELSTCHGGTFTGIQEWVYEGTITFSAQCNDWQLVYEQCCRNGAITTVNNPLSEELLIYSMLDNTISPCNNSPTFSNKPVPFVCQGQQFCFNHGAFDVDGDSLSYEVVDPLSYMGFPVQYFNPYNPYQPLNSNPPMSFDPVTGDFCITPQSPEVTVMAILVREYRNGVLIGAIERDIQVTVINCNNNLPTLTGINGTNSFSATICADAPFCFNAFSNDPDLGQNVTVVWNNAIPGANFNAAGPNHPTGTFCWTPTQADASPTPHCFTVQVNDDACPFIGSQTYSFCLTVANVSVNAGPDIAVNCGTQATIQAIANTSIGNVTYQWNNGSTSPSQTVGAGTYIITAASGQCTDSDTINVTTTTGPTANFSAPPVCSNTPVAFTDLSTTNGGTITSWNWNFNNMGSSNQQNPVFQFPTSGSYYVCLYVGSSVNCPDTVCQFITVNPNPVAAFSAPNTCQGQPVYFSNNSSPSGLNYSWDFGNGTTSGSPAPSVSYSSPGNYNVTLITSNAFGCADTIQQAVSVFAPPTAAFNSAIVNPCLGGQVNFTDASASNITAWNWDFGNGQTSTLQNPTNTFSPGNYNVTLTVTNSSGCTGSTTQAVTITPPFNANVGPDQVICAGGSATVSASGGASYLWSTGATTSSITVSPSVTTAYPVTISDATGCSVSGQVNVTVNPNPVPSFIVANSCQNAPVTISNNSTNVIQYDWDFGNGTTSTSPSPAITYTSSGNYLISLTTTDANGCIGSTQQNVTVYAPPVANFNSLVVDPCQGGQVNFTDASSSNTNSWNWNFGNGQTSNQQNPTNVFNPGTYNVTLNIVSTDGCIDQISQPVTILPPFVANIGSPQVVCYGNAATVTASGGTTYAWNTGQTSSSISVSPSTTTTYSVVVTDAIGCTYSGQVPVTVNPLPPVSAGTDQGICIGVQANLTATGALNYNWSTGANTAGITVSPQVNTTYIVTGTDVNGCINTDSVEVTINPNLSVNPGDAFICPGYAATLDAGFPGASYIWSNGQISQTITVNAAGLYSVTVTNPNGCTGIGQSNVTVGGAGLYTNSMNAYACQGSNAILDAGNPGCHYAWTTGDTTQTISVSTSGNYSVVVTDPDGCTTSFPSTFTSNPLPVVAFTATPVCMHDTIQFINNSSVSSGNISSYQWTFGDGNNSNMQNPGHVYSADGTYNVSLTAISDSGCSSVSNGTIRVFPLPVAGFLPSAVCLGDTTTFTNQSTISNDTINYWNWNFGDGTSANLSDPIHVYSTFGSFPVQLFVRSQHGCSDTLTHFVEVHPLPVASAGPDSTICSGATLLLGDPASANGVSYQWSPINYLDQPHSSSTHVTGENNTSAFIDLQYTLTATNTFGCTSSDGVHIRIKPLPLLSFQAPAPQCLKGNRFTFSPNGTTDSNSSLVWDFGSNSNPGISAAIIPPPVSYSTAGGHLVTLSYSYMGCPGIPVTDSVLVWEMPLSGFIPSPFEGCTPVDVTFYNLHSDTNYQYTWQIQGQTLNDVRPSWTFDQPGDYTVTQIVKNQYGCVADPKKSDIHVYPIPEAAFTNTPDSAWIYRSLVEFENKSLGAVTYQWDFGDGSTGDFFSGTHNYTDTGTFDITLIVVSDHGCRDTVYGKVKVYEGFSFYVPNAFTPNNDGVNDYFQGYGTFLKNYEMWIYDRWGLVIYHTEDYEKPWDGRMHSVVQNDTYVYRIVVKDYTDKAHVFLGSVTLVK